MNHITSGLPNYFHFNGGNGIADNFGRGKWNPGNVDMSIPPWYNPMLCAFPFNPNLMTNINDPIRIMIETQDEISKESKFIQENLPKLPNIPGHYPFVSQSTNTKIPRDYSCLSSNSKIYSNNEGNKPNLKPEAIQPSPKGYPKQNSMKELQFEENNRRTNKKCLEKIKRWSKEECQIYDDFIRKYDTIMADSTSKRMTKIFLYMAKFIETKNASQCRSHHQKFYPKVKEAMEKEGFIPSKLPNDEFTNSIKEELKEELDRKLTKNQKKLKNSSPKEKGILEILEEKAPILQNQNENQKEETDSLQSKSKESSTTNSQRKLSEEQENMSTSKTFLKATSTNHPNPFPSSSESNPEKFSSVSNHHNSKSNPQPSTRMKRIVKGKSKKVNAEIQNLSQSKPLVSQKKFDSNYKRRRNMCEEYEEEDEEEMNLDFLKEDSEDSQSENNDHF